MGAAGVDEDGAGPNVVEEASSPWDHYNYHYHCNYHKDRFYLG